jgi:glycerate-2-kinase
MLEAVFRAALAATAGERCVADQLAAQPLSGPVPVIALGKAASAMALGSASALGADLQRGLVVTRPGHIPPRLLQDRRFCCLEAGHPLPDNDSLAAGRELLGFIAATRPGERLLFLISGGTSSLVIVARLQDALQAAERRAREQGYRVSIVDAALHGDAIAAGTLARGGGRAAALEALRHADAGGFLAASGDLLVTGPTGTNVTDLVIGLKTG